MRLSPLIALLLCAPLGGAALAAADSPETPGIAGAPPATGPAATGPAATGPAATGPAATGPAATGPAATGPAATRSAVTYSDEAAAPDPKKRFPRIKAPSLLHKDQFGLSLLPGTGYRIIAPYKDGVPCGQQANRVCTGWIPFFVEAQPSFGFARHWDVIVDLRFGVAADFNKSHEFAVAPGIRYWVDADLPAKFFATFQGVYDLNPQHDPGVKDYDFGVRNANGFMLEMMRNLGFYLQFGETLGLVRWLRFEVDGGVGVQARFP
jgi:hypothetical protein